MIRQFHPYASRLIIIAISMILAGCQVSQARIVVDEVPQYYLKVPAADYGSMAWLSDNQIVFPDIASRNLTMLLSDGSEFHKLTLPNNYPYDCITTFDVSPVAVSADRAAFLRFCNERDTRLLYAHPSIFVLDAQTETIQRWSNYPITEIGPFAIAMSPDLTLGVGATYSGLGDYMFGIDSSGVFSLDLGLQRVNRPSWSLDGKYIAAFGNANMSGEPSPFWATQPYDLWTIPTDCITRSTDCTKKPQKVLDSVANPTDVAWSPNGTWLALNGDPQGQGQGIWLLEVATHKIVQIAIGNYRSPAWSPDGQRILVAVGTPLKGESDPLLVNYTSLAILEVGSIVNGIHRSP